jgi:hypothetical protein
MDLAAKTITSQFHSGYMLFKKSQLSPVDWNVRRVIYIIRVHLILALVTDLDNGIPEENTSRLEKI